MKDIKTGRLAITPGIAWSIVTKFGVCLETKQRCIFHGSCVGYICTCALRTCICTPFPYLGNGWTDCAEMWCVVRDPLARCFTKVWGGVHLHVLTCACAGVPLFPYLGNGRINCTEIWCVVREPFAMRFTEVYGGVQLHVRTCTPPFRISETTGRIALKCGTRSETH